MTDIETDDMFYIACSPIDLRWRLFDCKEESACFETLAEMRAFVFGLWRGMSLNGPVELTCAIFSSTGIILDTMYSRDLLT